jgi:hypothetical protein
MLGQKTNANRDLVRNLEKQIRWEDKLYWNIIGRWLSKLIFGL